MREKEDDAWKKQEEEAVTVFEKIKKTVFFTRLSVFVIVILFATKKNKVRFRANRDRKCDRIC